MHSSFFVANGELSFHSPLPGWSSFSQAQRERKMCRSGKKQASILKKVFSGRPASHKRKMAGAAIAPARSNNRYTDSSYRSDIRGKRRIFSIHRFYLFLFSVFSASVVFLGTQQGDLPGISLQIVGSFQLHGQSLELGMADNTDDRLQPDFPFPNAGMAVLVASRRIHAVVDMQRLEPIHADDPVKFLQDSVQIMDDIISAV